MFQQISNSCVERRARALLCQSITHADLIKCLFQIEIVEFVAAAAQGRTQAVDQDINDKDEMAKLVYAVQECSSSSKIDSLSNAIVNRRVTDLVSKAVACGWSFAYTQFLTDKYRYSID